MLSTVIEKEIRDIIGTTKFAVIFGACTALILITFYVGARTFQASQSQYEAAKAENLRQFEGLTDWFNIQSHRVFLPPEPVAALVTGIANDIGRTTEIQGRGELSAQDSKFNEDPIYAVFRFLDLEFLFQVVLSLFAILLGYDAISGEKERGTLRLSFANAIPRHVYILGKLLGAGAALILPLLLALGIGCLLLPLLGVPMTGTDWGRLVLIIGSGLLYFALFLSLAIFVSALTQRSSSSFLLLLAAWIMCVLIVPRAAVVLAGRAVDVPSVDEIGSQKMRFQMQQFQEDRENWKNFKPSHQQDPEATMAELNRFMEEAADKRDQKMKEFSERLNEQRTNKQHEQEQVALGLARISPAASLSLALTNLAGTSLNLKQHYKEEATAYQEGYAKFMKEKTGSVPGGRMIVVRSFSDDEKEPEPIDPTEIPEFVYRPLSFAASLAAAGFDIVLLVLYNFVFFAGAIVAFLRYDVR
ncbi:MAG: ABC transporter permease subunit [candidate division Zixibacteria bacterium]|nr:ABC transporter permease subunit [candidate division Zixibacteria bacterium]